MIRFFLAVPEFAIVIKYLLTLVRLYKPRCNVRGIKLISCYFVYTLPSMFLSKFLLYLKIHIGFMVHDFIWAINVSDDLLTQNASGVEDPAKGGVAGRLLCVRCHDECVRQGQSDAEGLCGHSFCLQVHYEASSIFFLLGTRKHMIGHLIMVQQPKRIHHDV